MPKMISTHRGLRVTSCGHSIHFPKGVEVFVPDVAARDCFTAGAQYANAETAPPAITTDGVEPTLDLATALTVDERNEKLRAAVQTVLTRNDPMDFTASGSPKLPALSAIAGFNVTQSEMRREMLAIQRAATEAGEQA